MKVFLDDLRPLDENHSPKDGWVRVMTVQEVENLLETGLVTHLSLDNDLGIEDHKEEGYQILEWIEYQVYSSNFDPPEVMEVHSANSVRVPIMLATIDSIRRRVEKRRNQNETPVQYVTLGNAEELPKTPFSQRLLDSLSPDLRSDLLLKGLQVESITIDPIEEDEMMQQSTGLELVIKINAITSMCNP